ncbi:sterol desaturase family protein [Fibrisoma montanum]|uniref:Sterol desaturase family protein n=1 Tax=Fibrisoma montanum TaxID=2305895 RepID=A0A418MJZ3_9BACT|nr:sterol desaturase family protein [Fibrisoma montanum]RIV27815.1 sterol desaturase family protein [Fibrisoma montanum]
MIDISEPIRFWLTALGFFIGIFGRYVLFSVTFWWLFNITMKEQFAHREVQTRPRRPYQHLREIGWSGLTSLIFTAMAMGMLLAWQAGYTRIYTNLSDYPWYWYPISILLVLFLHETYYYWLHRWMHRPGVYRWIHKTHHDSITTSAWTSFSFHPIESTLQAIIIPALMFLLPLHITAAGIVLLIMTISSAINHLNTEIYPRDFDRHWLGRWLIGATHHGLHHSQFRYNYGLYFTFWDRWMKTESPDFHKLFSQKTTSRKK